ncbi:hypothetical protein ACNO5E_13325 [Vibrio parahaemolyticus]
MKIQIRNNQIDGKQVKQIEFWVGDLIFHSDVRSDRDIKLAERLAADFDLELDRKDLS